MQKSSFIPIIGLEIHVELKTNSKMFCGCRNDPFHAVKPNIYTCPTCLGLPGALPVPNKKAIELTVKLGLGLGCKINPDSRFDRKHYFYPDLPKGYQISQYEKPFCVEGQLAIARSEPTGQSQSKTDRHVPQNETGNDRIIRIKRVHLEEDTGKLLHRKINGEEVSLIDFNRSGVPLVEIVTEPDIRSAQGAKETAKKIHQIVRSLEVSDADMEKGSMRLEANISLLQGEFSIFNFQFSNKMIPKYKVEIKNINSFRFLERAIEEEIERQKRILSAGKEVKQETRGWDTQFMTSKLQRTKEEAEDYRYFPEPDIPPIRLSPDWISKIKNQISKLPEEVYKELIKAGVSEAAAKVIAGDKALVAKVEVCTRKYNKVQKGQELETKDIRNFGNWVLHHQAEVREKPVTKLVSLFKQERADIVSDTKTLEGWISGSIKNNPQAVADFKAGKQQAIGFLIGQVQRLAGGKAEVLIVKRLLVNKLIYSG